MFVFSPLVRVLEGKSSISSIFLYLTMIKEIRQKLYLSIIFVRHEATACAFLMVYNTYKRMTSIGRR